MSIFKKLREEHETLLAKQAKNEFDVGILGEAKNYIQHVRKASSQVHSPEEREYLRANLRYWSSYIYEQTDIYPNIDLAPTSPKTFSTYLRQNWLRLTSVSLLIIIVLLLIVSEPLQTTLAGFASANAKRIAELFIEQPSEIVFAGQVEDENGRWLNDYVVVLFLNGNEISRTTSGNLDSSFSVYGPVEGVFELHIPNTYELNIANGFYYANENPLPMQIVPGLGDTRYLGTWFNGLRPGSLRVFDVPDRQLVLAVIVLPYPQDELPVSYGPGSLILEGDRLAQISESPTIQFTVLPSSSPNNGLTWNLEMTGYSGDRWDVWESFLYGRVSGLDWETFAEAVVIHNPHLESDNYIFYPYKSYLLPYK